jgi:serine/threonine-protein kinase
MEPLAQQPQIALPDVPGIGEVIADKYRVEEILGVGGMGVVLAARHLQLGQLVAIKVLSVTGEHRDDAIERFLREGRSAAALNSDHVVRIYDVGQLPTGVPFMVMERLRGQDLSSVLKAQGALPVEDAVEYVAQATAAIAEAHDVGVVHRDLKPSNLFLTRRSDGTPCVKVLDFGISKQLSDLQAATLQTALTSTRQVMGSPAYMSPEQVRDARNVDHRTDVWALGVTLYELLTQSPAFDADTLPAVCAAIAADPPVPLRERRSDIPEVLERIVLRCLEKQPAKRFATARALLVALRDFQGKPVELNPETNERSAPDTQMSIPPGTGAHHRSGPVERLEESGSRRVETRNSIPGEGTLVSERTPRSGEQKPVESGSAAAALAKSNEAALGPALSPDQRDSVGGRRARIATWSVVLVVGVGAVTAWTLSRRTAPTGGALTVPTTQVKPSATHFVLRLDSNPSKALVLEGGNPIGVTPLEVSVERSSVQRSPRQFQLHKDGYIDATIEQRDATADVERSVQLMPTPPTPFASPPPTLTTASVAPSALPTRATQSTLTKDLRPRAKSAPQRSTATPEPEVPGIRGNR